MLYQYFHHWMRRNPMLSSSETVCDVEQRRNKNKSIIVTARASTTSNPTTLMTQQIKWRVIHPACEPSWEVSKQSKLAVDAEGGYATVQTGHDRPIGSRRSSTSLLIGRRICLLSGALPFCHTTVRVVGGKCRIWLEEVMWLYWL